MGRFLPALSASRQPAHSHKEERMTREKWLEQVGKPEEMVFRISRGCDRCGFYLPNKSGVYVCVDPHLEIVCRKEHEEWIKGKMDV